MTDDTSTATTDEAEVEETSPEEEAMNRNIRLAAATTEIVNRGGSKYKIRAASPEVWDTVLEAGSPLDTLLSEMGLEKVEAIGSGKARPSNEERDAIKAHLEPFATELEAWPKGICAYYIVLTQERAEAEAEAETAEVQPETADQE